MRELARERVKILSQLILSDPENKFCSHWIKRMLSLCKRWAIPVPRTIKGKFCPACFRFWIPGKTCTINKKLVCACGYTKLLKT